MRTSVVFLTLSWYAGSGLAQVSGHFVETSNMTEARFGHTATLLPNGKVLIAGGHGTAKALASAELYDPDRGFISTGSMNAPRASHSATLLPDGRVLIVGGSTDTAVELYDPETGSFSRGPGMSTPRYAHTATLLNNGKVLIAGGSSGARDLDTAELYDPAEGTFTPTGNMTLSHVGHRATLLPDGRVLISPAGDGEDVDLGRTEIYDPDGGSFHAVVAGQPAFGSADTANLLFNGKVLITLGAPECDGASAAEIFDPVDSSSPLFSATGAPVSGICRPQAALLSDGSILVAGGWFAGPIAQVYDAGSGSFSRTGDMTTGRHDHTATLLNDGTVLIAGGSRPAGDPLDLATYSCCVALAGAELYYPATLKPAAALLSLSREGYGPGAIQHAGTYEVVSDQDPATPGEAVIIYCTGLVDGSVIPPQVSIGGRMAEVLWFGNTPGFTGLNQINVRVPAGMSPGPAMPVRLYYLGRPSNLVTIGVGQ